MDPTIDPTTLPHDNRGSVVIGVVCLVLSIATTAVALRFYTRWRLLKQVGADDWLVLAALVSAHVNYPGLGDQETNSSTDIGLVYCTKDTRFGLGSHVWDLKDPVEIMNYQENFYVSITMYNSGLMFVKLTFLMQYYRVLAIKKMRTICIVAMVIVGGWSLSQVLVGIFICHPIAGFWDSSLGAKCIPNLPQWYINAAGNIATDILIFVLPMPVLSHLKLPRRQKYILLGIFALGFFTCAISVVRIKYLRLFADFPYENVDSSCWSISELCSGVTCACLPTLRPLVSKWVPSLSSSIHRKSSKGYNVPGRSGASDVEKGGSKHTRGGSRSSKADLYRPDELLRRSESGGDMSDGIYGLKTSQEEMRRESMTTPLSPRAHRVSIQVPSVTTEITGGWNAQPVPPQRSSSKIQIKREFSTSSH